MRIGALHSLRINDIEKMDNLYKITIYRGDREEYFTFCTPECAKEIDSYLKFRKRRGEKITGDSYLLLKQFDIKNGEFTSEPFSIKSLRSILEDYILISGIRKIDHKNPYKRKSKKEQDNNSSHAMSYNRETILKGRDRRTNCTRFT